MPNKNGHMTFEEFTGISDPTTNERMSDILMREYYKCFAQRYIFLKKTILGSVAVDRISNLLSKRGEVSDDKIFDEIQYVIDKYRTKASDVVW